MRKKLLVTAISFIIIIVILGFITLNKSEGYVFSTENSEIWVIDLTEKETKGKSHAEINSLLEEAALDSQGTFYTIPLINRLVNKKFKHGDKVRIYWYGDVIQTAPGKIEKTSLIKTIKQ